MKYSVLLIVASCFWSSNVLARGAYRSVTSPDGKQFHIFDSPRLNWFDANNFCTNILGNKLAAIESQAQYDALRQHVRSNYFFKQEFWTAGNNIADPSNFVWYLTNSQPMNFTKWIPGEPNNHRGRENCVEVAYNSLRNEGWNDEQCTKTRRFICEGV